ncbi:MAG: hypothetical protein GY906_00140 [bacterium]|nr:hypothetical protein [bacterium]
MKALNKDPFKRYADAGELASEIRRFREFRPVAAKKTSVSEKLANWARRRPTLAAVSATLILVATVIGLAAASQASVESRLVSGAYERIDQREQEIAEIESEMREIRSRTDFLEKGGDPDAAEQLLELKARRELRTDEIRSLASAIMGFTIFSPDGRAQRILHDDLFDEIRFYLEAEDDHRSRIAIEHALEWYGDRNLIGITDDEADWLRQQGEVVKERQSGG